MILSMLSTSFYLIEFLPKGLDQGNLLHSSKESKHVFGFVTCAVFYLVGKFSFSEVVDLLKINY